MFLFLKKLLPVLFSSFFLMLYAQPLKIRGFADTVGFAHTKQQMDSVMKCMERQCGTMRGSEITFRQKAIGKW